MTINMTVKAKNGAIVYDFTGAPIPGDQFVTVPMSASLVNAVRAGDLEEMEEDKPRRSTAKRRSAEADSSG